MIFVPLMAAHVVNLFSNNEPAALLWLRIQRNKCGPLDFTVNSRLALNVSIVCCMKAVLANNRLDDQEDVAAAVLPL